jgi:hypothetical protein
MPIQKAKRFPPFQEDKLAFAVPLYRVDGKIVSKEYYFYDGETFEKCRIIQELDIPTNKNKKKTVSNKG